MEALFEKLNSIKAKKVGRDSSQTINIYKTDEGISAQMSRLESKMDLILYLMEIREKQKE